MALAAAVEGLAAIAGRRRVHLYSDSAYLVNCVRERWWERWEKTGWKNRQKQPVANRDLWERLLAESRRHDVVWHKVRGHSGDPLNERVDQLRSEEHTSELQSHHDLVCRLLLEKKKKTRSAAIECR